MKCFYTKSLSPDKQDQQAGSLLENAFLLLMIGAGAFGAFNLITNNQPTPQLNPSTSHQIVVEKDSESFTNTILTTSIKPKEKSHLEISNTRQVGVPIHFTVNSYNEHVSYMLDFGNGHTKKIKHKINLYEYKRSGQYTISLIAIYKGKKKRLQTQTIRVKESSMLAEG